MHMSLSYGKFIVEGLLSGSSANKGGRSRSRCRRPIGATARGCPWWLTHKQYAAHDMPVCHLTAVWEGKKEDRHKPALAMPLASLSLCSFSLNCYWHVLIRSNFPRSSRTLKVNRVSPFHFVVLYSACKNNLFTSYLSSAHEQAPHAGFIPAIRGHCDTSQPPRPLWGLWLWGVEGGAGLWKSSCLIRASTTYPPPESHLII